jgi:DNA mismatch endonuclease, patch repair protein
MAAIKSKNTSPELLVRSVTHRLGFRFRLHSKDLPGKPDLVFRPRKKAIFVHGCFWHQHGALRCRDGSVPKSNVRYWSAKLAKNVLRDQQNIAMLKSMKWKVLVIWECETRDSVRLSRTIKRFLNP